jgi:hypothetical protein
MEKALSQYRPWVSEEDSLVKNLRTVLASGHEEAIHYQRHPFFPQSPTLLSLQASATEKRFDLGRWRQRDPELQKLPCALPQARQKDGRIDFYDAEPWVAGKD